MNLTILTSYYVNYQPLADLVLPNREEYCRRHGYGHYIQIGPYDGLNWHQGTARIKQIYDMLFKSPNEIDSIWCLDIDAIIMNLTKKVEDFLDDDHDFFIAKDVHGVNGGSFIVRKSEWAKEWLYFLWTEALIINHCWHENRVMHLHAETNPRFKDKIKVLPHPSINSYFYDIYNRPTTTPGHFNKGDFVLHLPGLNIDKRLEVFRSSEVQNAIVR